MFLGSHLKGERKEKETGKTNFNNISYFTNFVQNIIISWHLVNMINDLILHFSHTYVSFGLATFNCLYLWLVATALKIMAAWLSCNLLE